MPDEGELGFHSPLVGRGEELSKLKRALDRSLGGANRLVLLEGEAGIGKTRLLEELVPHAKRKGLDIVLVRCSPQRMNDPYGAFMEILNRKLSERGLSRDRIPLLGLFEAEMTREEREARADVVRQQSRIFELVSQFIIQLVADRPMCILIDDIHNADVQSLKLLHYVVRSMAGSRAFVCGTYRPEELEVGTHQLREMIQRMTRERLVDTIALDRLTLGEVTQMVGDLFPDNRFPGDFLSRIYEESEGNPLFLKELLKTMVQDGAVHQADGVWRVRERFDALEIPATIRDAVSRRVLRLGSDAIDALRWASVIGDEFSFELLRDVMGGGSERAMDALEELLHDRLVVEDRDLELYRFSHMKIREVVYDGFVRGKPDMHQRVAQELEKLAPSSAANEVYDIAYHFSRAQDHAKTAHYSTLAGKRAMKTYALNEAHAHFTRALEALAHLKDDANNRKRRLEVALNLGDIQGGLGEMNEALEHYGQVIELGRELGDDRKTEMAFRRMGIIFGKKGDHEASFRHLQEALRIAEENGYLDSLSEGNYDMGILKGRKSQYDEAIGFYAKSLEYAEKTKDLSDIGLAFFAFAELYRTLRIYDKALENAKKALENWERIKDFRLPYAYHTMGGISLLEGNANEAISYYEKAIEHSRRTGDIYVRGYALSGMGEAYTAIEELDTSLECLQDALEIFERLDIKEMIAMVFKKLGIVYRHRKDWDRSKDYFDRSLQLFEKMDMPLFMGEAYFDYAAMFRDQGRFNESAQYLNRAMDVFSRLRNDSWIKKVQEELGASGQRTKIKKGDASSRIKKRKR